MHPLQEKLIQLNFELNPPVSSEDLKALEAQWGEALPRAAQQMLSLFDGVKSLPEQLKGKPVEVFNNDLRFMTAREMCDFLAYFPEYGMYDEEQNSENGAYLDGGISDLRDLILPCVENEGSNLYFFFRHELLQDYIGYLEHDEPFNPSIAFFSLEHLRERIEVVRQGKGWMIQYDWFDPVHSQGNEDLMKAGMQALLEQVQQEGQKGHFTRAGYFFTLAVGLITQKDRPLLTRMLFDPVIGSIEGDMIRIILRTLEDWQYHEAIPALEQKLRELQTGEPHYVHGYLEKTIAQLRLAASAS